MLIVCIEVASNALSTRSRDLFEYRENGSTVDLLGSFLQNDDITPGRYKAIS